MSLSELTEFRWKGRTGPFTLLLTPGVFTPTHTSLVLAEALEINPGEVVIDIGCGSGVLSFVAANLGADRVVGCDVSAESVRVATENARRLGLADRTEFRTGNLFEPVQDVEADVIIGDVSGIPDVLARLTGWFPGGPTGTELPMAMLAGIGPRLKRGGRMYLPTGTVQAGTRILDAAHQLFGPDNVTLVAERDFPLPSAAAASEAIAEMVDQGLMNLTRHGSRLLWRLAIWRCVCP
jgi:SAM-dependent methyltransferase